MAGETFYPLNTNLESNSDEELILLINQGDGDALNCLLKRYRELVQMKISKYFIVRCWKRGYFARGNDRAFQSNQKF